MAQAEVVREGFLEERAICMGLEEWAVAAIISARAALKGRSPRALGKALWRWL